MQISANTYPTLISMHNLALLSDWLAETNELLVYIDLPHSGGRQELYFIKSLLELRAVLAQQTWPEIRVMIFRDRQYPIRGLVTDSFITTALESIPDGQHYVIIKLGEYPSSSCEWLDDGNSHEQLKGQLDKLKDEMVGIGEEPWDTTNLRTLNSHTRVFSFSVSKNQNYYEPYGKTPEKYAHVAQIWDGTL